MRRLPIVAPFRVRNPCGESLDDMPGNGRERFCSSCNMTVHDVAALTRSEATALLRRRRAGHRVCVRIQVRRSDGAVLLADGHAYPGRALSRSRSPALVATVATVASALAACAPPVTVQAPVQVVAVQVAPVQGVPITPAHLDTPLDVPVQVAATSVPEPVSTPDPVTQPEPPKAAATKSATKTPPKTPPKKSPPKHVYDDLAGDLY